MKTKNFSLTQLGLSLLAKTFFFSVFSFLGVGSINAQKVAWAHFQNGNYLHSKFTTSSISWGTGSNRLKNPKTNAYFTEYVGFNQQFDVNGKVLFTVISTVNEVFLFDRNNKYVAPPSQMENTTLSPEISIVPLKAGVVYHILAGGLIWEYNIAKNSIADHANKKLEYGTYKITFGNSNNVKNSTMQSVRIVNDGCNPSYYIYCINANKHGTTDRYIEVLKVQEEANTINSSNSVFKITKIDSLNFTSSTIGSFDNFHCPMELSSDGSKLCVVGKNKILIYNVDPTTGKLAGLNNTYNIPSTSTEQIAGIEFANNTTVYFAYYDLYNATTSSRGIYHWNFTGTNSPVKITGSESFSNSMIEKGLDGKLYTLKADGIYVINTTTNTISNALTSSSNLIKQVDLYSYLIGGAPAGVSSAVYYLPDQIDGQTNEYLDLSETVFTYNLGASFSGSYNWSNASHGFTAKGSGKVLVLNAINITSASSPITMDGMTIEFYDDAVMNISPSSSVTLKGTILKASNCGLMWQGIKMMKGAGRLSSAGAQLFMKKNSSGQNSQVLDAHIGVNLFGIRHRLEITEQTLFTANERHLQITEGDKTKIKIWESNFNGSNILRDQNKGSNIGHNDNKNRTIDGITIIKSNVIIGDPTKPHNNIFGGQNGVIAVESSLEMTKTNISFTKSRGLWFNANNVVNKELKITQSSFYNLNYGMRIEGKTAKTTIQQCSLYNTNAYAIQYIGNPGGKLTIGDKINAALGNSFNNCNWAAIECFDNAKYINIINAPAAGTQITIANNNINNHVYATGVSIGESHFGDRTYGIMHISYNSIGRAQPVGRGIALRQITGANGRNPVIRPSSFRFNSDFKIDTNFIQFTTILNKQYSGISAERVQNINYIKDSIIIDPTIVYNTSGTYKNGGFGFVNTDGKFSLIHNNTLKGGIGLQVNGNAIFSNYYCNNFDNCINGLQLARNSVLRNPANCATPHNDDLIHADAYSTNGVYGRPNNFYKAVSWGADIDFKPTNGYRHQWDFVFSRIPTIVYAGLKSGCGIEHAKNRTNPCGTSYIGTSISDSLTPYIEINDIQDSVLKWKMKYDIIRDYLSGNTSQQLVEPQISGIISIENQIRDENYTAAKTALNAYSPSNYIEADYKTVYNTWVDYKLNTPTNTIGSNKFQYDTIYTDSINFYIDTLIADNQYTVKYMTDFPDSLVSVLEPIARQSASNTNPAAVPARAILWAMKQLQYFDTLTPIYPNITGYVNETCATGSCINVYLKDSAHQYTGIQTVTQDSGFFAISGSLLQSLDSNKLYYLAAQLPDSTWVNTGMAKYTDLAFSSYHVLDCNNYQVQSLKTNNAAAIGKIIINPNPTQGYINLSNMPADWLLEITDISGKNILSKQGKDNTVISLHLYTKGLYFINITNTKTYQRETHKVILD